MDLRNQPYSNYRLYYEKKKNSNIMSKSCGLVTSSVLLYLPFFTQIAYELCMFFSKNNYQ